MAGTTKRRVVHITHKTEGYNAVTRTYDLEVRDGKVRLQQTQPSGENVIRFEMEFEDWREMVNWIDEDIDRATMESLAEIGEEN